MGAADLLLANQPKIGLMNQDGRLQRRMDAALPQIGPRHLPELGIDKWHELFECCLIALAPVHKKLRDLTRTCCVCNVRFIAEIAPFIQTLPISASRHRLLLSDS